MAEDRTSPARAPCPTAQCARRQRPRPGQEHLRGAFLRSLRPGLARGRPGRHRQRGVPSNRVVWEALRPRGVEVVEVGLAGDDPESALLAACGPRTRLLSISAVQYASGLRLDLERIGAGCRRRGVLFCIDAIQQLGALPFDVQAYDCAFAMADGHEVDARPRRAGRLLLPSRAARAPGAARIWLAHAGTCPRLRASRLAAGAQRWRFECGSPNMLGAMALEASLGLLEEVGMERVGRDIAERVQWLQDGLSGIPGVRLHSPRNPSRRAGILTFSLDGQDNRTLFETLRQERVICAQRGGGIRFPRTSTRVRR